MAAVDTMKTVDARQLDTTQIAGKSSQEDITQDIIVQTVAPLDTRKKKDDDTEFFISEAMQMLYQTEEILSGADVSVNPNSYGSAYASSGNGESYTPESVGLIGGNPLGEASVYLIEEQDTMLKLAIEASQQQAQAVAAANDQASNQLSNDLDAANDAKTAGELGAWGEISAGIMGLAAAGGTMFIGGVTARSAEMNETQTQSTKLSQTEDIIHGKAASKGVTVSEREPAAGSPEANARKSAIEKDLEEHGYVTWKTAKEHHIAEDKYADKTWRSGLKENRSVQNEKGELELSFSQNRYGAEEGRFTREKDKFDQADLSETDKQTVRDYADRTPGFKEKIAERQKTLRSDTERASHKLTYQTQLLNTVIKDFATNIVRGVLDMVKTTYDYEARQEEAQARLDGTMSSSLSSTAQSFTSLSQSLYSNQNSLYKDAAAALVRAMSPA